MAVHGSLAPFNKDKETWEVYTERLDFYFEAHDIAAEERKRSILLSVCGSATYEELRNLVQPASLKDKSYKDLVDIMKKHLNPASSKIMHRYKLFTAVRRAEDSIGTFVSQLRAIGQNCARAYSNDSLNDMLRDAFVFGVNNAQIQRRLFQEKDDFTFETAIEIATAIELSGKDASQIQANTSRNTVSVQRVRTESKQKPAISCYRCGGPHLASHCRYKDAVCRGCGKKASGQSVP